MSISGELGCAPCRLYLVEDLEPFYAETELMYLLDPLYALRKYSRHVSFNAISSETLCDFVLGYRPRHCPYTELPAPFSHVPLSRVQNLNTPTSRRVCLITRGHPHALATAIDPHLSIAPYRATTSRISFISFFHDPTSPDAHPSVSSPHGHLVGFSERG